MDDAKITIVEVTDPAEIARSRAAHERMRVNNCWLQEHWPQLLPGAIGRFVAVAGQEAFVADTSEKAWKLAEAAYPDDDGAFCQYVRPSHGPRIYGNRWIATP